MIIDANSISILKQLQRPVQVYSPTTGYYQGEYEEYGGDPVTKNLIIIPISGEDLRNAEQGSYTAEDKMVLEIGSTTLKLKDKFTFNSENYEIHKVYDFTFEANLAKYIAKKIWASQ
ncbi:MAG: hypothetical protein L6Q54_06335 [Leptospiraceae bacterium]|nr:hypothetical protein [Leptospiraceae bacterium]MCK6380854.1 hypothetical protein [Leptospiraceae bacterium]